MYVYKKDKNINGVQSAEVDYYPFKGEDNTVTALSIGAIINRYKNNHQGMNVSISAVKKDDLGFTRSEYDMYRAYIGGNFVNTVSKVEKKLVELGSYDVI